MHLRTLTNDELARFAYGQTNELTSTPLEIELLRRLEEVCVAADAVSATVEKLAELEFEDEDAAEILERAAQFDLDADGIHKLGEALILNASNSAEILSAIGEAGYDNAAALKADLALAETFTALASDAGAVFSRLATLTETATT